MMTVFSMCHTYTDLVWWPAPLTGTIQEEISKEIENMANLKTGMVRYVITVAPALEC